MKRLSAFLGLGVLVVVLLACKKGDGSHCYLNKDCKDTLVCASEKHQCRTLEEANADCAASSDCKSRGWCKADIDVAGDKVVICLPKSDEDCKQADCAKDGCTYHASTGSCSK